MSDELREMVRNKVAARAGCKTPCRMSVLDCACLNTTDAAAALIRAETLEEAAKVAESYDGPGMESVPDAIWGDAQATKDDIAYYIRALKDKP